MLNNNPADFSPTGPRDFIGPARLVADILIHKAAHAKRDGSPMRILLVGTVGEIWARNDDHFKRDLEAIAL